MPEFRYLKSLTEQGGDEYLGNIWGWKNSFRGLAIILFFFSLYFYRLYTMPAAPASEVKIETASEVIDR